MSAATVTVTMECADCKTVAFMTLATPEAPFRQSRGRVTLPRQVTHHECPTPRVPVTPRSTQ